MPLSRHARFATLAPTKGGAAALGLSPNLEHGQVAVVYECFSRARASHRAIALATMRWSAAPAPGESTSLCFALTGDVIRRLLTTGSSRQPAADPGDGEPQVLCW
jgi:hypothetical protein